jgi:uncharacterized protein (TIGR02996 family)
VLQLTSPAARGLLRAIVEDPADDVPRLLLADVLEEAGDEARAEFIRVQCRIATLDADMMSTEDCGHPDCPGCKERRALRRRERELLVKHWHKWCPALPRTANVCLNLLPSAVPAANCCAFLFRRGFVASVNLTCADWCGGECPCYWTEQNSDGTCSRCLGTGRTGRHGPALVLAAPIEDVTLTDVGFPYPAPIATFMDPPAHGGLIYASEQVPRVVSRAALAWARREVGLPGLRP